MLPDPTERLGKLKHVLAGRPDIELAVLFGSQARGQARPDSDFDLAVQGRGIDRLALGRDLSLATDAEVDVVDLGEAGYPLLHAIVRDAVFLHQGRPGAAGDWLARAVARLETDRPWFERMRDAFLRKAAGHG